MNNNKDYPTSTVLVAFSVFSLLSLFLIATETDSLVPTIILLAVTIAFPFALYNLMSKTLPDFNYVLISNLFYLKIVVSIFILKIAWEPLLGGNEGYDPIRYFYYAKVFAQSDFNLTTLGYLELLSPGIIFLYALIVKTIGWNPVIPFLINSILSFVVCMLLTKTIYVVYARSQNLSKICIFALLVPDLVWFDIITSRDSVATFFLCCSVFFAVWLMDADYRRSKTRSFLSMLIFLFVISNIGLVAIRPGMILVSLVIVIGILLNSYRRKITKRVVVLFGLSLVLIAIATPIIVFDVLKIDQEFIESKFTLKSVIEVAQIYGDMGSANSLSAKMIPSNLIELILYTPIKVLVYMFVSITLIPDTIIRIFSGDFSDMQLLFMGIASLIYIFLFPRFIAVFMSSFANQKNFLAVFPFIATIFITVLSNQFIHERYRLMSIPFFIFSVYPSYSMDRDKIAHMRHYWLFLFAIGLLIYLFIKL